MLEFEFDEKKSTSNLTKHGIDFRDGQALWNDSNLIKIEAKTKDGPRFISIGKINDAHWSAVTTIRGRRVRIISIRRARKSEVNIHESYKF